LFGNSIRGHAEFLARLRVAETRLETDRGRTGSALRVALGLSPLGGPTGGWNLRTGLDPHGMGTAIDLNYDTNPYVGGDQDPNTPAAANTAFRLVARNALRFSGEPQDRILPAPRSASRGADWDQVNRVDQAIETYFSMLSASPRTRGSAETGAVLSTNLTPADTDLVSRNVRAFLTSRGESATDPDVATWVTTIRTDFAARQNAGTSNWARSRGPVRQDVGIMNLQRDLVVALCDVAGLRWGASGFSEASNGDIQHFDASEVIAIGGSRVNPLLMLAGRRRALRSQGPVENWRAAPP